MIQGLRLGINSARRSTMAAPVMLSTFSQTLIATGNEMTGIYTDNINTHTTELTNVLAQHQTGQTLQSQHTDRATLAAEKSAPTEPIVMVLLTDASHDIEFLTSGSITAQGTTLFNTYLVPTIQAMTAAGYDHVFVPTIIERDWTGSAADITEKEAERIAYNQLVRDNASIYGYTTSDFSALSPEINRPAGVTPDTAGGNVMATFFGGLIDYSTSSVIPLNGYEAIYAKANRWITADNSNYLVTAGSAIQQMTDRSGYERHASQSNASDQALSVSGHAQFDGDDHINVSSTSDWEYFLVSVEGDTAKISQSFGSNGLVNDKFFCIIQKGSSGTELFRGFTVPELYVDGTLFTGTTRDDLFTAIVTDTPQTVLIKVASGQSRLTSLFDAAYGFGFKGLAKEVAFLPIGSSMDNINTVASAFSSRAGSTWTNI